MKKIHKSYSFLPLFCACLIFFQNAAAQKKRLDIDSIAMSKSMEPQRLMRFEWIEDGVRFRFADGKNQITVNPRSGKRDTVELAKTKEQQSPRAFTEGRNLFVQIDSTKIKVNTDSAKGILYGSIPSRNEYGIHEGFYFSPGKNNLAFYRIDESKVAEYPLVDIHKRIAQAKPISYPMAGMASQELKLGVFNLQNKQTVYLQIDGPADQYLTCVSWDPSEKYIYTAVLDRSTKYFSLNQYDVKTGAFVKTLFKEENEKYLEPSNPMFFIPNNPSQFVWMSQCDGYNHLYLYNTDGKLIKQLTSGNWIVKKLVHITKDGKKIYFTGTKDSPLEMHLYVVDVKSGAINRVTKEKGVHHVIPQPGGNYFIDVYSNLETAYCAQLLNAKGELVQTLRKEQDLLKDYAIGETEIFTIKSKDQTSDLYCRMIKPYDFDSTKKYPVIVYVYGGPHVQNISASWLGSAKLFLNFLAQEGYLVFTLDNRGSGNRGFAFESATYRNFGTVEVDDQMQGVNYLKSLPYVDSTRIGVDGWSYGGFMALSLKLKNPGVFKVATAGGPVVNWEWYEIMYGERYMETPQKNPDGYKNANLLNYINQLDGKLMLIHGAMDPTVVLQHSLMFISECVKQGKQVDYFIYPDHEHNVRGNDRAHLYRKLYDYYRQNL